VAILGIAFFTFVVAFMRAAVYMLGESQNPRWDELKTSVIVGTVALGIGLGSPLAGLLSGRRVELRLVLLGAVGMITLLCVAAWQLTNTPILVACIIGVGVFTGFYIVPLFTLLQHRAPKTSKGEMIATSNFINVVGAITSSALFWLVVTVAQKGGLAPEVKDRQQLGTGVLVAESETQPKPLELRHGRAAYFRVTRDDGAVLSPEVELEDEKPRTLQEIVDDVIGREKKDAVIEVNKKVKVGDRVSVTRFDLDGVPHYELSPEGKGPSADYDNKRLPVYLFLGAAAMTLLIALALGRSLLQVQKEENGEKPHG
jgi:hypothetical protein